MPSPRKYSLDLVAKVATEVWNFPMNESIHCPFCGSVYEDAPLNYLIDYAFVNGGGPSSRVRSTLRPERRWRDDFSLSIPDHRTVRRPITPFPIHLENTKFPTVGPQALNLSTRGARFGR